MKIRMLSFLMFTAALGSQTASQAAQVSKQQLAILSAKECFIPPDYIKPFPYTPATPCRCNDQINHTDCAASYFCDGAGNCLKRPQ